MNNITRLEVEAVQKAHCYTPDSICNAMRGVTSLSHDDLIQINACFAAMVQKPSALSDKGTRIIVDLLDEILGQIANDQIEQQAESAWAGRDDSWMAQQDDMPMFTETRRDLAALTIRVAL